MVVNNKMSLYSTPFTKLLELNIKYLICEKHGFGDWLFRLLITHKMALSTYLPPNLLFMPNLS